MNDKAMKYLNTIDEISCTEFNLQKGAKYFFANFRILHVWELSDKFRCIAKTMNIIYDKNSRVG